jgi:UPF0288 family protein (methanogenesis marker protein 3)
MIAKTDHEGGYGVDDGRFGRVTRGRHILGSIEEGERIVDIRPVVLELSESDAFVTTVLDLRLEEGMAVDTYAHIALDPRSPISSEHLLVLTEGNRLQITDRTATYSANSNGMDVSLVRENVKVREEGDVTVRSEGSYNGRVYFYRKKADVTRPQPRWGSHPWEGAHTVGPPGVVHHHADHAHQVMTIGLSQRKAGEFLANRGLRQRRTGLTDDDAIVAEQEPETYYGDQGGGGGGDIRPSPPTW